MEDWEENAAAEAAEKDRSQQARLGYLYSLPR